MCSWNMLQSASLIRTGLLLLLLAAIPVLAGAQAEETRPPLSAPRAPMPANRIMAPMAADHAQHPAVTSSTMNSDGTTSSGVSVITYKTTDPLGVYSGRPYEVVGDILDVNTTSHTITVAIDRSLSSLPHILKESARRKGVLEKLMDRELPTSRTYAITRTTLIADKTRASTARPLDTLRQRLDRERIKLEELHPGMRVSMMVRYFPEPDRLRGVLNVLVQPRDRKNYEADYRIAPILRNPAFNAKNSSQTAVLNGATSATLQYRKFSPPVKLPPPFKPERVVQ